MANQKKSDFLVQHYDKLILGAVLLVLLGSLVALLVSTGSNKAESAKFHKKIQALDRTEKNDVARLDAFAFDVAQIAAQKTYAMAGTNVAFLVAPERVVCVKCAQPIPTAADVCPWCHEAQPDENVKIDETWDSDGDGIPDEWEKAHGLDPFNAADAALDPDNDGFSNLEEFLAGTDPRDGKSHPPRFAFLRVRRIEVEPFPFSFNGSKMKGADGEYKFVVKAAGGRDWYVKKGQELGKTGFVLKDHSSAIEERQTSTGKRKLEIFTLFFANAAGDEVKMKQNAEPESSVYKATFVCVKDAEPAEQVVKRNEEFSFDGETFKLLSIDRSAGAATLRRLSSKEEVVVPAE